MVRRTNLEVANIIEAFVEGTGGDWDWDDFCSFQIENRELDAIRINPHAKHPERETDREARGGFSRLP